MRSASWGDYVEDPLRARLIRSSAVTTVAWWAYGFVVVLAIVLVAFATPGVAWLVWIAAGLAVIAAYATPVAYLSGARIRRDIEARLTADGVQFSGHPPTHSAEAFKRWMVRNGLAPESVRAALRRA